MSGRRVRVPDLRQKKLAGEKIAMLTAYDATMARLLDHAGIDVILVGDSLGTVILGQPHTLNVTLDAMIHHTGAVARGVERALVVTDMPFLTYQVSVEEAVRNAGRLLQSGAAAVKLEGGRPVLNVVRRLVDVGIPVMGHLGLQPQSVHKLGGYGKRATEPHEEAELVDDAVALEQAGAFAIVLEAIPSEVARAVTSRVSVPTIGIGSGAECDGQVLVSYDMLGLFEGPVPSFVKEYANLAATVTAAVRAYADDVRAGAYPPARSTMSSPSTPLEATRQS